VIVHSLHWPRTQFELQDMGILWARSGCAVLVMDQLATVKPGTLSLEPEAYHSLHYTDAAVLAEKAA